MHLSIIVSLKAVALKFQSKVKKHSLLQATVKKVYKSSKLKLLNQPKDQQMSRDPLISPGPTRCYLESITSHTIALETTLLWCIWPF